MRIALFTETYLPYINGVVTHVKLLREGLEKLGHTVLVVTSNPNTHHHYIEDGVLRCPPSNSRKSMATAWLPLTATPVPSCWRSSIQDIHPHGRRKPPWDFQDDPYRPRAQRSAGPALHAMYDNYVYYVAPKHLSKLAREVSASTGI